MFPYEIMIALGRFSGDDLGLPNLKVSFVCGCVANSFGISRWNYVLVENVRVLMIGAVDMRYLSRRCAFST